MIYLFYFLLFIINLFFLFFSIPVEYADYSKDPDNYVRVCVDIKGLQKATFGKNASNADISLHLTDR